jgi:hypothetical protein
MRTQLRRHSGESRNPDDIQNPHAEGQQPKHGFVRYAQIYSSWIPAFAGMTAY